MKSGAATLSIRPGLAGCATLFVAGCSLFSQTPDPQTRHDVRAAVPYGADSDFALSRLAALGFVCTRRQGDYYDESGHTRNADHLLVCDERPTRLSFTCENRNQVTVVLRDDQVSGIEVTRGPSCERN